MGLEGGGAGGCVDVLKGAQGDPSRHSRSAAFEEPHGRVGASSITAFLPSVH